ncbi:MAG: Trk system potassium transporter TrkA [Christensenellaceae bacterium]|jgi:trk system potassium uptake protein TrkA|nr:Trk system potassium transporter TrkA [Christensenellaceae bacterium]
MRVVIVGDGKVGYTLAEQLSGEGHDIVVIDKNREVLRRLSAQLDVMVLAGNGASLKTQREAEVGEADLLIAATSMDEINLLCCIVARKLGCKHTIARVRSPEYNEQIYAMREELGLSMSVNPEWATAREIHRLLRFPSFLRRESFAKGRAEIVEIELKEGNPLIGKALTELEKTAGVRVLVCAVERGENEVHIPSGPFILLQGDKIYVTAPTANLALLVRNLQISRRRVRSALLIGGGRITYYLATMLLESGMEVKIIERRLERCEELAELLAKATIVHGDGTDKQLLLSEGIEQSDAIVALTDIDEENILLSMFALHLRLPKVVTKINRTEYNDVFRDAGLESVVSPKLLCASEIVRYVRAMQNRSGGEVLTIHPLVGGQVEAIEFEVTQSTRNIGRSLAEIRLKPGMLIACINRGGRIRIPSGKDRFELSDTLIVVAMASERISDLNEIFE